MRAYNLVAMQIQYCCEEEWWVVWVH